LSLCNDGKKHFYYDFYTDDIEIVELSSKLKEISGIAFSTDDNLFGHNDEKGTIYQIDPNTGKIIKFFQLGFFGLEEDFEDIEIVDDAFFLITSSGILYQFQEGSNLEKVKFKEINLEFSSKFEIEGLCYDPEINSLLVACKNYAGKNNKGKRAVYSFSLQNNKLNRIPRFLISLKEIENKYGIKEFFPSAISRQPETGNFFILSSKGEPAIIEINSIGDLVSGGKLSKKRHPQPEGLAFKKNGDLLISNEAVFNSPTIIIYKQDKD
jgi:uncharacterized protein YjiK